ncbi:MAG: cobyrinate a,c-diamide synthase [Roseburia sp.]
MKLKRIMIAAPKSGSGKTTITCAVLEVLKNSGQKVVSYKCGPDYIDPMFHEKVLEIPSKNLDTFFTSEEITRQLFLQGRTEEDFAVLEGAMGIFDGLGGIREEGSSYHLAKVTETPIVLIIDAKGMGRSVIPMIAGFLKYDKAHLIQGVILNRMSKAFFEVVKPLIEQEVKVKVLGYFPDRKDLHMESRHLGLVMPNEREHLREQLQIASKEFRKTVSVEAIQQIAEKASELEDTYARDEKNKLTVHRSDKPVIAVAKDEAFCFYYEDNLRLLQESGAEIKYFSPLHDSKLPNGCHALLIGGGYPELYMEELSGNVRMRAVIKHAFDNGMPIVAECGGFMYLHSAIIDKDGVRHPMVGAIPAACSNKEKLVRFGYIEIKEKEGCFLPEGERIKGHEFHYFDSTDNGASCIARKPTTGRAYPCVIGGETYWLGFPHLYYPSNPVFAKTFVKKAEEYKKRMEAKVKSSHRFFENKACKYFPCHKGVEEFNCLFCFCPLYHKKNCPGNPQYTEKERKRIKVCTNCTFPHQPENYDRILQILKEEK